MIWFDLICPKSFWPFLGQIKSNQIILFADKIQICFTHDSTQAGQTRATNFAYKLNLLPQLKRPFIYIHGRPHTGANGVSWPPWKMDEKLKSENMQKRVVFRMGVGDGGEVLRVTSSWSSWWWLLLLLLLIITLIREYQSSSIFYEDPQIQ